MIKGKVGIILPTYKPKYYVLKAFESIEKQTLSKDLFTVYIGLNGSTKEDEKFLLEGLKNYSFNFKYFFIKEGGVSNARNKLLDEAQEEYITFVDDDDIISENYLEELLKVTDRETLGISNSYYFSDSIEVNKLNLWGKAFLQLKESDERSLYKTRRYFSIPSIKMFHRDMIGDQRYDTKLKLGEDALFCAYISKRVKRIKKTPESARYYLRVRATSATKRHGKFEHLKDLMYLLRKYLLLLVTPGYNRLFMLTRLLSLVRALFKKKRKVNSKKKNIAFFLQMGINQVGGAERILSIIGSALAEKDYNVTIISNEEGTPVFDYSSKIKFRDLGMTFGRTKLIRKIKPLFYIRKLRKILKSENIDIVIPLMPESAIMSSLARYKGVKVFPWIHSSFYSSPQLQEKLLRKFFIKKMEKLIVLNSLDSKAYGELNPNVAQIPNPSYLEVKEGAKLEKKVIMAAGRISKVKGFDKLIKAFKPLYNRDPEWKVKIYGKDWGEQESLEKLAKELGVEMGVEFLGAISDMEKAYKEASIYAMTSEFECFPMVLLEAKECGLPIVAFDCKSGPRDIVKDGEDGYLVKEGDLEAYSNLLVELAEKKEKRKEFGIKAKENIKEYDLTNIINLWEELLKGEKS